MKEDIYFEDPFYAVSVEILRKLVVLYGAQGSRIIGLGMVGPIISHRVISREDPSLLIPPHLSSSPLGKLPSHSFSCQYVKY